MAGAKLGSMWARRPSGDPKIEQPDATEDVVSFFRGTRTVNPLPALLADTTASALMGKQTTIKPNWKPSAPAAISPLKNRSTSRNLPTGKELEDSGKDVEPGQDFLSKFLQFTSLGYNQQRGIDAAQGDPGAIRQLGGANTARVKKLNEEDRKRSAYQGKQNKLAVSRMWAGNGTRQATAEEWAGYTPQQRAAVEANAAIVEAVNLDKAGAEGEPDDDYKKSVESLFGKDGGSATYAPNTVAVLGTLGLTDKIDDLDNYLNLRALTTGSDLKFIGDGVEPTGIGKRQSTQIFSDRATSTLARTLSVGQSILDSALGRGSQLPGFDPIARDQQGTMDNLLDQFFWSLAKRELNNDEDRVASLPSYLGVLEQDYGLDSQTIFDYLETRLQSLDYARANGEEPAEEVMTSDEFRNTYFTGGS